ncbi:acetyl-CoA synthetase-like protein [Corynespora cassiicola Philippines]|uniref:Acetyl-CoA synthetase-like protein n=1 Tax=Corynespora cassiicola Philippines TaxID=1448308 RepID=A0A2T2NJV9_CORCC|nr:acetyl-CoA synthetase-like protein [Corynespora cassiicola Philippines]
MPQVLDRHAAVTPDRLYASIPKDSNMYSGFQDVTCSDMARCVNFMAHWIVEQIGSTQQFETIAYIGIPDLRSAAVFLGALKAGYKVLFPSPRNPQATNLSLMEQTGCRKLLYAVEVSPVTKLLALLNKSLKIAEIPSFDEMVNSQPEAFPYDYEFEKVKDDPVIILHSSGSTGIPKPITMTHASFAVVDHDRNRPTVPGRRNRDYSIFDFKEGGRFYTIFPYFHVSLKTVNPILTDTSSPVLGPPLMPPSGVLLKEIMKHQSLRALYLPPSIAEQLLSEPDGLDFFRGLDFVAYTGGPFSPEAGAKLSAVTELCPFYGSTEAFHPPQIVPESAEDWSWMEWSPYAKLEMQPSNEEEGAFELVLFPDSTPESMSALSHNLPGVTEYRTKDLFKQHPHKAGLWKYYGRRDDIIVLSNGAKFNPVPLELAIQNHEMLSGALVVGMGRVQASLLVEAKPQFSDGPVIDAIWPAVDRANRLIPAQGHIMRNRILVASELKPFVRAGKGTVVRRLTEQRYQTEIDVLYSRVSDTSDRSLPILQATSTPRFKLDSVTTFVAETVKGVIPDISLSSDADDFFAHGLDSVRINQLLTDLRKALRDQGVRNDLAWIDTQLIFHNSNIGKLAAVIYDFLSTGKAPETEKDDAKVSVMRDLLERYSQELPKLPKEVVSNSGQKIVLVIGSTGYLGPHIVASLLKKNDIGTIYCLNRSPDSERRTLSSLHRITDSPSAASSKLHFLTGSLTAPDLGLDPPTKQALTSTLDAIIFNAWTPNFTLPLPSFSPFLHGLGTTIALAAHGAKRPRITLTSSLAAIGNWPRENPRQPLLPERTSPNARTALDHGYGESKWVAEQLLWRANAACGVPVCVVRAGQIGGAQRDGGMGDAWPAPGWLEALVRVSREVECFPEKVSPVDWVPVDVFAGGIAEVACKERVESGVEVFNMVHPDPRPFGVFVDTLRERFGMRFGSVGLIEWLEKVGPGRLTFYGFMKSLGEGREGDMGCETGKASAVMPGVAPITQDLLVEWLKGWNLPVVDAQVKV